MNKQVFFCRQCHRTFTMSESEQQHFKIKGWAMPAHCPACRKMRRDNRDPYEGWERTMMPEYQKKKRHTRIHYAPYVVGGLRG